MDYRLLKHYGILGMHWGVRRENPSGKSAGRKEHEEVETLKKQRLGNLSNEQLKKMIGRENAIRDYRKTPIMKGGKRLKDLTTGEILLETKRNKLRQQLLLERLDPRNIRYGWTKVKDIDKLNQKQIDDYLNRFNLAKNYKDLKSQDIENGRWLIKHIITGEPFTKDDAPEKYKGAFPYTKSEEKQKPKTTPRPKKPENWPKE